MNKTLADIAERGLTASGFETENTYCMRWVRQCVQAEYNSKYDELVQAKTNATATAKHAAWRFLAAGMGFRTEDVSENGGLQVGDILFKTRGSGGFGHVGILVEGNKVAENSTFHWNRSGHKDARGKRTLAQFGMFHIVGRLPDPNTKPAAKPVVELPAKLAIVRNGERHLVTSSVLVNGRFACGAVELLDLAGVTVTKQVNRLGEPQPRVDLYLD